MYGTQARVLTYYTPPSFENDVKMYGTQATPTSYGNMLGLRMM